MHRHPQDTHSSVEGTGEVTGGRDVVVTHSLTLEPGKGGEVLLALVQYLLDLLLEQLVPDVLVAPLRHGLLAQVLAELHGWWCWCCCWLLLPPPQPLQAVDAG